MASKEGHSEEERVYLLESEQRPKSFGFSFEKKSRWFQLVFCCIGVFVGFLINGVCEEFVFKQLSFGYVWYFTAVQSLVYLILAYGHGFRLSTKRQPWSAYLWISIALVGTSSLTKASLMYINYPAHIMFKSSKVLPVMAAGALMPLCGRPARRYSLREYGSATLLAAGLAVFCLADSEAEPMWQLPGLIMVVASLGFDALLGNLQEAMFVQDPLLAQQEVLFCTTLVGLPFLIPPLLFTGELGRAWDSGLKYPMVYVIIVAAAIATYGGQLAILTLINLFGVATTYVVTSMRKALTLALSYIIFTKPFSFGHFVGFLLILFSFTIKGFRLKKRDVKPEDEAPLPSSGSSGELSNQDVELAQTAVLALAEPHTVSAPTPRATASHKS